MSLNLETKLTFKGDDGNLWSVQQTDLGSFKVVVRVDAEGSQWGSFTPVAHADDAWAELFAACKARKVKLTPVPRAVCVIAREIARNWASGKKGVAGIYFGAVPYLDAMRTMETATENYGADDGKSILLYFLGNANAYRGGLATAHKLELKALAGVK